MDLLLELIGELFFEVLFEAGLRSFRFLRRTTWGRRTIIAILVITLGAVAGGVSAPLLPASLVPPSRVPVISLVMYPLLAGFIMYTWGERRREAGKKTSPLATFSWGALFAFAAALVRWLILGGPSA